ncbi:hypothetical protein BH23ACT7_BH23ACT7_20540 [soil metagenome]
MGVEALVAFAGGGLSLLSSCSALLLPAFFAYAFPSRGQLVLRTGVFYLGLLTLFIPLGLGLGAIGSLFLERRAELSLIAGLLLIAIGSFQLVVGGFELPGAGRISGCRFGASGESLAASYALGLVYGIGGFCSGPLLGGVLTIAGASGGALDGALLLATFAAGMAAPLLILALLWERLGVAGRGRLRGRRSRSDRGRGTYRSSSRARCSSSSAWRSSCSRVVTPSVASTRRSGHPTWPWPSRRPFVIWRPIHPSRLRRSSQRRSS